MVLVDFGIKSRVIIVQLQYVLVLLQEHSLHLRWQILQYEFAEKEQFLLLGHLFDDKIDPFCGLLRGPLCLRLVLEEVIALVRVVRVVILIAFGDVLLALRPLDHLLDIYVVLLNDLPHLLANMLLLGHLLLVDLHVALQQVCILFELFEFHELSGDSSIIEQNRRAVKQIFNLVDHSHNTFIFHRVDVIVSFLD